MRGTKEKMENMMVAKMNMLVVIGELKDKLFEDASGRKLLKTVAEDE